MINKGGTIHEQVPILGMIERDGVVIVKVVENRHKETIANHI